MFYNKQLLLSGIKSCLRNPDNSYSCNKRMCFEKQFEFKVVLKNYGRGKSYSIKTIYD